MKSKPEIANAVAETINQRSVSTAATMSQIFVDFLIIYSFLSLNLMIWAYFATKSDLIHKKTFFVSIAPPFVALIQP